MAVGRTILQAAYYMLKRGEAYHELGEHYLDRMDRERTSRRLIKRLEGLGFDVAVKDQTVAVEDDQPDSKLALPRAA